MFMYFDRVNTGELPTSECNQQMRGILAVYEMYAKTEQKVLKSSKVVMQNQTPILVHRDTKSPNFYNNDPRSFKQRPL